MNICKIEGCYDEEAYAILGVCKACYSGLSYWKGRPRAHKEKRLGQMARLTGRMEHIIAYPRNVPHKRRTKK